MSAHTEVALSAHETSFCYLLSSAGRISWRERKEKRQKEIEKAREIKKLGIPKTASLFERGEREREKEKKRISQSRKKALNSLNVVT